MKTQLVWLHEKALGLDHPFVTDTCADTKIIHVWDDNYYKKRSYSLKRLVFIYECLCESTAEIIRGDTIEVLRSLDKDTIIVPFTPDTIIRGLTNELSKFANIKPLKDDTFCDFDSTIDVKRFFKYWNIAKKTAFTKCGEPFAKHG